jgi:hypothetical protein
MKHPIVAYHLDAEAHWVAELRCGHGQHVRHDPPWQVRPWVTTPEGRASHLGMELDCVRCDRGESSVMSHPESTVATLLLPGLSNSGPEHWQSHWERSDATCVRVEQTDWETPRCSDWVATLDAAIGALDTPAILVAHSSACALVAHWARSAPARHLARVRGALLVAPSDPEGPRYPVGPTGFAPVPQVRLPFRSIVVASADDEYVTLARARAYAAAWGSEFVDAGAAGHLNSASRLGAWPAGYALLEQLRRPPSIERPRGD